MFTRTGAVPTTPQSLTDILGPLPTTGFGELLVITQSTNTASFYLGNQAEQSIELPNSVGVGFSFEKEDAAQIYVVGTAGDEFTVVGLRK